MQLRTGFRPSRLPIGIALLVLAMLAVQVAAGARTAPSKRVVKLEQATGGPVLANLRGRTLYSLSVERHGKFICTGACLSIWRPLLVPKGVRPTGPVSLGTVERPEGKIQVTFRGRPLYRFTGDTNKGETKGEGFRDVGTWHAARTAAPSSPQPTEPSPAPYPYPTTPTAPYPTTPAPSESPAPTSPTEPPYQYPPYGY